MYLNFKSCTIFALQLLFCVCNAYASDSTPPPLYDKIFDAINRLSQQIEMFNVHYITKLDEKFVAIMQMVTVIDTNVKNLQERSQAWDIFSHHMTAWSDHFKNTDQKFEILKKNLDLLPVIENQIQNTDFKVQHVFEKTDMINEKLNEINKALTSNKPASTNKAIKQGGRDKMTHQRSSTPRSSTNWSMEDFEQTEILLRLSKIQRLVQNNCNVIHLDKEFEENGEKNDGDENSDLKAMISQINSNLEKFPLKEIKQSFNLNKKHEKTLESLSVTINHIDERTVRIFDTNSYQFKKQLANYKNTEGEILSFTNNANFLLKKVEKVMKNVIDHNSQSQIHNDEKCNFTISRNINTHLNETRDDSSDEVEDDIIDQKEYTEPTKTNCFQLTNGRSGVYKFGEQRQFNDGGRDFLHQNCEYSTDGSAWLVIQRRDNFEIQEQFNRSWIHYKHGFGNLFKDFWFGNDFIHNFTSEYNMTLRIVLEDFQDNHVWIEYGSFKIDSEENKYKLHIADYRGAVADSLISSNEHNFITFDANNSNSFSSACAASVSSGWWWSMLNGDCAECNLNGVYRNGGPIGNDISASTDGIYWRNWLGNSPLKASRMMIRPQEMYSNNNNNNDEDYTQLDDF
ncbi:hypothetical protein PVAND_003930 [Polypedilum vanderplanki]|uniref:Fibrinogen C-terminal domain-containing protein n=1 Tax=Polypedilum vanderplanki TaxID=319348 RepID=A0A9J6BVI6_POLVA|nr:hypothetical protein PVAND_003930 [Polypedilum vanderplanki]